jgi:hypothetical protein
VRYPERGAFGLPCWTVVFAPVGAFEIVQRMCRRLRGFSVCVCVPRAYLPAPACRSAGAGRGPGLARRIAPMGMWGAGFVIVAYVCVQGLAITDLAQAMLRRRFSSNMVGLEAGA